MNDIPSPDDRSDVDEQYRQAASREQSAPSDAVRRAVLAHAAARAAERSAAAPIPIARGSRHLWWRGAGLAAAAAVVGVIVWPRVDLAPPNAAKTAARQSLETSPYATAPEPAAAPKPQAVTPAIADQAAAPAIARAAPRAGAAARPASGTGAAAAPFTGALAAATPRYSDADLRQAAELGDITRLQSILESPLGTRLDVNARDANGRTAILLATMSGAAPAVQLLLAHGADPSIADATGATPLQLAIVRGRVDIVEALRRAGAR
jgi:hypothetical protein